MKEKNHALSQRENYTPSGFTKFLWWLSTAEKELLYNAAVDGNRYRIVGMTVLATWAFATLAWTYFFSTVAENAWLVLPLGLFMGFIILTIDRALIKGINRYNKNRLVPLLFRGILAATIGVFMAQPALLYLFKKEIRLQTSLDNEQRRIVKQQEIDSVYQGRKANLLNQQRSLQQEDRANYALVAAARNNFLAETDGSGGTGKIGIKDIAIAKRNEYLKLEADYKAFSAIQLPKMAATELALTGIETAKQKELQQFSELFNDGFLTQIAALNNLLKNNPALQYRYYLLVTILLLIELMPVIAKTLLPSGTYDERVVLREAMEKDIARSNMEKEKELKELYNSLAHQYDQEAITAFFNLTKEDRHEKMKLFSSQWKEQDQPTFDGLWAKMKKEILTRQEN